VYFRYDDELGEAVRYSAYNQDGRPPDEPPPLAPLPRGAIHGD
jgi:hypothetical protein